MLVSVVTNYIEGPIHHHVLDLSQLIVSVKQAIMSNFVCILSPTLKITMLK